VTSHIQKNPERKKELSEALSINLRRRAQDNNIVIDDTFRNLAGINMRLLEVEKILHPDRNKFGNTSELIVQTTELYINHRRRVYFSWSIKNRRSRRNKNSGPVRMRFAPPGPLKRLIQMNMFFYNA
jgi:hypothetical protein